jgi:hypothetical protein
LAHTAALEGELPLSVSDTDSESSDTHPAGPTNAFHQAPVDYAARGDSDSDSDVLTVSDDDSDV